MTRAVRQPGPDGTGGDRLTLDIGGREVPLRIRRNPKARRLILRIDTDSDGAIVTLPSRVPLREGVELARARSDWILRRLAELSPRVPFADGARVPYLDQEHVIHYRPGRRGVVWREGREIQVAGRPEHTGRRVRDWFKAEARARITGLVAEKTEMLGRGRGRITLRDTRSRWGSCSANGNLSFCWRLIMVPEPVLDYVVAHEVAHLAHRDHGPAFWRAVQGLTRDADAGRAWLRRHGESLHRYG